MTPQLLHRRGIDDGTKTGVTDPGIQQRAQQVGRITISAGARIVSVISNHQRTLGSVDEKHETFVVPLRTIGDLVLVKTFTY